MKIIVSGAGIAGLSLAYWLHEAGHHCTIVEKSPDMRTEGYFIDFGGTGWDVANRMGLIPALEARQLDINHINFIRSDHQLASSMNTTKVYEAAGVAGKFMVLNRRDIAQALYEHVKPYTQICFDRTITTIEQSDSGVQVTLSDGSSANYDLVVGADGIHSHVRKLVFGQEEQFTRYLGYHFSIFIIPAQAETLPNGFNLYLEAGKQVSVYEMDDGQWMVFFTMQQDQEAIPARHERYRFLQGILQQMGWVCPQIASALTSDMYIFYDTITQIINPQWYNGRVVLIGDAAHCPTLVSGQGASMAMAGAYFLTQALQENESLSDALQDYDAVLRPHIDRIQSKARDFAPNFIPSNRWKIALIHWVTRLSDFPIAKSLIGKQFSVKSVLEAS